MSRFVDVTRPLNEADRQYLLQRNRTTAIQKAKQLGNWGGSDKTEQRMAQEAEERLESNSGLDAEYGKWSKQELQEELAERGLPTSGNVGQLVARLDDDDRQNSPDA